jgi:hypothetical protein
MYRNRGEHGELLPYGSAGGECMILLKLHKILIARRFQVSGQLVRFGGPLLIEIKVLIWYE